MKGYGCPKDSQLPTAGLKLQLVSAVIFSHSPAGPGWCLQLWWVSPRGCRCERASCSLLTRWENVCSLLEMDSHSLGRPTRKNLSDTCMCNENFQISYCCKVIQHFCIHAVTMQLPTSFQKLTISF